MELTRNTFYSICGSSRELGVLDATSTSRVAKLGSDENFYAATLGTVLVSICNREQIFRTRALIDCGSQPILFRKNCRKD